MDDDSEQAASTQFRKRKIMVVDDNVDGADSLGMLLEFMDYDVRTVYDGLQAVELARTWQPDLVILDINMPVMDGYEAARKLRSMKNTPRLVLVALTARTSPADRASSKAAGFDLHLAKPIGPEQLAEVVDQSLHHVPPLTH